MKKFLLVLVAAMSITQFAMSQDVIILLNSEEIQAKVKTVGINEITYIRWDNLDGPVYELPKSDILYVKYANGQKEIFNTGANVNKTTKPYISRFQSYIYLGADLFINYGGPSLDVSIGARTSQYFYIGGGVGWHNLFGRKSYWLSYVPFTSDFKFFIPTKSDFNPRLDLSVGGVMFTAHPSFGIYMNLGAGFDYRRFSFGVGCQMLVQREFIPLGYIRLGIRLGK